jgi:tRNA-dihydrouridine synthase B
MRIGNLNLPGTVFAAPLAGISNRPFRVLAARCGAALTYTEMVSSDGIVRNQAKTLAMMSFRDDERPIGIQLFGANPEVMARAVKIVAEDYLPDVIDLNLGCPVRKVVNKNGGAAILKNRSLMEEIICAAVGAAEKIPVTVKTRSGWDDSKPVYLEVGEIAERAGVAAITLHARSRAGAFAGRAKWSDIKLLKEAVSIIVIGNGDVATPLEAERMFRETGCDAIMIGRASLGNPMIFRQVNEYLRTGKLGMPPCRSESLAMARLHAKLMAEEYGETRGVRMMRRHFCWYCKGFPGASELRKRLVKVDSLADIDSILSSAAPFTTGGEEFDDLLRVGDSGP